MSDDNTENETGQVAQQQSEQPPAGQQQEASGAAASGAAASEATRANGRGGSLPGWLALLLVLALGAAAVWALKEAQQRETRLLERVQSLESLTERELMDAAEQQAAIRAYGESLQDKLNTATERQLSGVNKGLRKQQGELGDLQQSLDALRAQLEAQADVLAGFGTRDRESWLLAEVQYLLRLANQRLLMTGDTVSARALLGSADDILRDIDSASLYPVRRALATDLAALRALPKVDVEGLYLRLAALIDSAADLSIFELPEAEQRLQAAAADNWQGRLRQGWEAALAKLSDYVIIRRREVPMQALMDPQWEGLVRQNLRMLLEQAQVALLSSNERLYRQSLERARHWVAQFADSDEAAAASMDRELQALAGEAVAVDLPDLSASLAALKAVLKAREASGGGA